MLQVKQFVFNPVGVSTFLVINPDTGNAIVVDPGMVTEAEQAEFDTFVRDNGLHIIQVVNTHLHFDHCLGDNYVHDRYGAPIAAHPLDAPLATDLAAQSARFGLRVPAQGVNIDVPLKDGDVITLDDYRLDVIHVPGHTPGSIALYCPEGHFVIAGDALFLHAIGRTDLPGGNHAQLIHSVRERLLTLPEDTTVLPGHDIFTTVAEEKAHNPFV